MKIEKNKLIIENITIEFKKDIEISELISTLSGRKYKDITFTDFGIFIRIGRGEQVFIKYEDGKSVLYKYDTMDTLKFAVNILVGKNMTYKIAEKIDGWKDRIKLEKESDTAGVNIRYVMQFFLRLNIKNSFFNVEEKGKYAVASYRNFSESSGIGKILFSWNLKGEKEFLAKIAPLNLFRTLNDEFLLKYGISSLDEAIDDCLKGVKIPFDKIRSYLIDKDREIISNQRIGRIIRGANIIEKNAVLNFIKENRL